MKILDLLFPKRCLGCGRVGKYFCDTCALTIRVINVNEAICPVCEKLAIDGITHPRCRTRYSLDGLTSLLKYDGIVKKALKSVKYRYISDIAEELMQHVSLTSHIFSDRQNTVFVPVPLHKKRFRFRGFNQSEIFARILGKMLNIPVNPDLLIRTRFTVPQVEVIKREKRLKNMDGVFAVPPNLLVSHYLHILLVDDVFTTGATMRSATNVLKRAGFRYVWGLSIAR